MAPNSRAPCRQLLLGNQSCAYEYPCLFCPARPYERTHTHTNTNTVYVSGYLAKLQVVLFTRTHCRAIRTVGRGESSPQVLAVSSCGCCMLSLSASVYGYVCVAHFIEKKEYADKLSSLWSPLALALTLSLLSAVSVDAATSSIPSFETTSEAVDTCYALWRLIKHKPLA